MSKVFKAIGNAITGVAKAVVKAVSGVVKAVVNVVSSIVNFVASPFMGLLGGVGNIPNASEETARQDGVLIQRTGSRENIPIVYGYRKVAGKIIFAETGSTNNKYLWVAYVFSEGLVEGVHEVWLDDTQLSTAVVTGLNAGQIVNVPDAKYAGRVQLQWFPGVYYANPRDSQIGTLSICKDAPSWKSSNVYNGLAVLFARYEWLAITTQEQANANPFSGQIPNIQLSILGKRVASLRCTGFDANNNPTGTAGTENIEYGAAGYQERYSTNPAEILLDYLRNPRYGKGLKNADIDFDSFYVAAFKCNTEVNYTTALKGPILTLNAVVDTGSTLFSNVKMLLQNFRGYLPYVQGRYKLKIEDAGNPLNINSGAAVIAATFDKNNIIGDIQYTAVDRASKYNYVQVNWVDPDQKWSVQQVVYPYDEATRQYYINLDGGRENNLEITLGAVTNPQIANDFARLLFNKSRFQESATLRVSAQAFNLEPGDNIYIQGNILNFSTVPWRIVSIKLNDDYTFDLNCVRNPDFIYPYVTPNTPDTVIAPYVPIGGQIRPPTAPVGQPVGIIPPVNAALPQGVTQPVNTLTNPPVTVSTGTLGGGVGGSTSSVAITNVKPTPAPEPKPLDDIIALDRVILTVSGETALADVTFKQPENAAYKSLLFWYKPAVATETVWRQVEITDRPGPGQNVTFKIGPLLIGGIYRAYDTRSRVTYTTGELSTRIGKAQIDTSSGQTVLDPSDSGEIVQQGWTLNTTQPSARRDDQFASIVGIPQLSGGSPTNPRTMNLKFAQDLSRSPANYDVIGVKAYYKLSAATYWDEAVLTFKNGTYVPGATVTTEFTGYLNIPGADQFYDWIFRFRYSDGSEGTRQLRYTNIPVESYLGSYNFNPFYGQQVVNELASAFSFQTVSQGEQTGAIVSATNMTIGVGFAAANRPLNSSTPGIELFINPPDASIKQFWRGTKVYYRPVVPGNNPAYQTFVSRDIVPSGGSTTRTLVEFPITYDQTYQYVVLPLYYDTVSNSIKEGSKANIGQGSIHGNQDRPDYPPTSDWGPVLNFQPTSSSEALGQLTTGFAQIDPTIVISEWRLINQLPGVYETKDLGSSFQYGRFYRLSFTKDHIGNFTELHIYRRSNSRTPGLYDATTNPGSYGYGRWELIVLDTTVIGAGTETINLRAPVAYTEFKSGANSTATQFQVYYNNVSLKPFLGPDFYDEFIFVVKTTLGFSSKALYYKGSKLTDVFLREVDLRNQYGPATTITWPNSSYEPTTTPSPGRFKTFAEARFTANNQTPLATNQLWLNWAQPVVNSTGLVTKPISFPAPSVDTTGLGVI